MQTEEGTRYSKPHRTFTDEMLFGPVRKLFLFTCMYSCTHSFTRYIYRDGLLLYSKISIKLPSKSTQCIGGGTRGAMAPPDFTDSRFQITLVHFNYCCS